MYKDVIDFNNIDISFLTDNELMNLKSDIIESQNGYYLNKLNKEINRRFKDE